GHIGAVVVCAFERGVDGHRVSGYLHLSHGAVPGQASRGDAPPIPVGRLSPGRIGPLNFD
ncbi:MAG TPA: hypothetical protein VFV17_05415, partial [Usitatibacteraceae bacterium]|nr:hypothetical protein [Usitatibacteraceae bacterium]